ncbi:cadherin-like domain-containing protein [Muricoccus vinaceus]|uniref:Cadherin-like domain-containing protein n=1 Tax=Muricoccus vinaceus TaxID=424704 RepID=A0ABV6ISI5_9PROT
MLTGTQNNDTFLTAFGKESISAGNGQDRVIYDATAYVSGGSTQTIDGGAGTDTLTIRLSRAQFEALKGELDDYAATLPKELNFYDQNIKATADNPFQLKPDMLKALMAGTLTTGQNNQSSFFTFNSIGVSIKQFEALRFEVVNAVPVVSGAVKGTVAEDGAASTLNALANASDSDPGAVLLVMGVPGTLPAGVTYDALSKTFTLDPSNAAFQSLAAGETTIVKVSFMVSDGIASSPASVCWTVTGTNDGPKVVGAENQGGAVAEDAALCTTGAFTFTDADLKDGHTLSVTAPDGARGKLTAFIAEDSTGGQAGTVCWTYALDNNKAQSLGESQVVTETWTLQVSDGKGGTVEKTVTITITGTNDAPVLTGSMAVLVAGTEDADHTVTAADLLAGFSDVDGDTLSIIGLVADHGTVTVNADGTFTITPAANHNGEVVLRYNVIDGQGGMIAASQSFTLAAVNDAPKGMAAATLVAGTEDTAYTVSAADLLAGFSDVDDTILSVSGLAADHGTVTVNADGTFTITPAANHNGAVNLTYSVVDAAGAAVPATQSFTLAAVNDAAVIGMPMVSAVTEDADPTTLRATGEISISDADQGQALFKTVVGSAAGNLGALILGADGTYTYSVANSAVQYLGAGETKTDTFTVQAFDDTMRQVSFTIHGVNDAPVITAPNAGNPIAISFPENSTAAVTDVDASDVDGVTISYSIVAGGDSNLFNISNTGVLTFKTAPDYEHPADCDANNFYVVTVQASDGALTDRQTITVKVQDVSESISIPSPINTANDPNDRNNDTAGPAEVKLNPTRNNDVLVGTSGPNIMSAGNGDDTVYGGGGNDSINGNNGADRLYGQTGDDAVSGENDNDTIYGGSGEDAINGGNGSDLVYGGSGNDTISDLGGNLSDDTIYGGSGHDRIDGGNGEDLIIGGYGADTLTGGAGQDTFLFLSSLDTGDTITDFRRSEGDLIDLRAIDGTPGGSPLSYGGQSQTFSAVHSVTWHENAGKTIVQVDIDGNLSSAEFVATLNGTGLNLQQTDFIL